MYYVIVGGTIYEAIHIMPTTEEMQEIANEQGEEVYIIRGEHAGLSVEPSEHNAPQSQMMRRWLSDGLTVEPVESAEIESPLEEAERSLLSWDDDDSELEAEREGLTF